MNPGSIAKPPLIVPSIFHLPVSHALAQGVAHYRHSKPAQKDVSAVCVCQGLLKHITGVGGEVTWSRVWITVDVEASHIDMVRWRNTFPPNPKSLPCYQTAYFLSLGKTDRGYFVHITFKHRNMESQSACGGGRQSFILTLIWLWYIIRTPSQSATAPIPAILMHHIVFRCVVCRSFRS